MGIALLSQAFDWYPNVLSARISSFQERSRRAWVTLATRFRQMRRSHSDPSSFYIPPAIMLISPGPTKTPHPRALHQQPSTAIHPPSPSALFVEMLATSIFAPLMFTLLHSMSVSTVGAQSTVCPTQFKWVRGADPSLDSSCSRWENFLQMANSLDQNPCVVNSYLADACSSTQGGKCS